VSPVHRSSGSPRGFTIIEVLITASLLMLMAASVLTCLGVSNTAMVEGSAQADLESSARRVLNRIAQDFRAGVLTTLSPYAPVASSTATVTPVTGYANGAVTLGTPIRFQLVADPKDPANGKDDDKDGYVDEGSVVRTVGAAQTTIAGNVKSLTFALAQTDLTCSIVLERTVRGKRTFTFTDSIKVRFRN